MKLVKWVLVVTGIAVWVRVAMELYLTMWSHVLVSELQNVDTTSDEQSI